MRRGFSRWTVWALGLLALAAAVPAALLTVFAWARAQLPYNEEGNHFDGLVVHHEGSVFVYAALALVCWLVVVSAGLGACLVFKQARDASSENAQR
jgi:hypothetical protein